MGRAPKDL
jgi:hypothetical protein